MLNSMPLLAKTSAVAIGCCAGMRELEPAGGVIRCGRYDGRAAPLAYRLRARERSFPGIFLWSMDLQRGSALERGAKSLGLKSLWCHVAVVCRYGEHWSNVGWLP
jgi:hypothetical protein